MSTTINHRITFAPIQNGDGIKKINDFIALCRADGAQIVPWFSADKQISSIQVLGYDIASIHQQAGTYMHLIQTITPLDHTCPMSSIVGNTRSEVSIGSVSFGKQGELIPLIAGPCAIESESSIHAIAGAVAQAGGHILRGGAFKPRSSPYSFQGLGVEGLRFLHDAGRASGLGTIAELTDIQYLDVFVQYVDMIQVGARNMSNFALLKALAQVDQPIVLKRGLCATYHEWQLAAEYLMSHGSRKIILCERGIRTFETATRNTLDLTAVPYMQSLSHLPVIVDPSHGVGVRAHVPVMAQAAVACGADGVMVEAHIDPDAAWSDAAQTINIDTLAALAKSLQSIRHVRMGA